MAKDYSNIEGLIGNVRESIRNAYDKGYKQGVNDGSLDVKMRVDGVYEKGLNDAWEYAKKIVCDKSQNGYSLYTLKEIFGTASISDIFSNFSPSEATSKIREYEEKQKSNDEIKVGDEVICYGTNAKSVVLHIEHGKDGNTYYKCFGGTFGISTENDKHKPVKTGRHFELLVKALEQLKEAQDEDNTSTR